MISRMSNGVTCITLMPVTIMNFFASLVSFLSFRTSVNVDSRHFYVRFLCFLQSV